MDGMGYLISKLQRFEDEVISVLSYISIYIYISLSCHIYDSIFVFFSMFHIYVSNLCLFVLGFSRMNLDLWHAWKTQLYGITVPRLVRHVVDARKQNTPGGYNHVVFPSKPLDVILNSWWWWWWRRRRRRRRQGWWWWWWWWRRWYCLKLVAHCVVFSKADENKPLYSAASSTTKIGSLFPGLPKPPLWERYLNPKNIPSPPKQKKIPNLRMCMVFSDNREIGSSKCFATQQPCPR